jgi:hypothetical protein
MSYATGSLLSIGSGATLEQVVVLSDGRVATKLFAGKPVVQRDILNLSDWLLLTDGQEIMVTVNNASTNNPLSELAEPTVYPVGTMLRWIKGDQNKRVAIVMKDSLLQVKEVIDGQITMHQGVCVKRTYFKDFAEWKASLPEGGSISAEPIKQSGTTTIEEKAKAPIVATTDAGYITELSKRYLVRSQIYQQRSINDTIEDCRSSLKLAIQHVTLNTSVDNTRIGRLMSSIGGVCRYAKWLKRQLFDARNKTPQELSAATFRFKNYYKQKLFAYKGGLKYEICANKNGIIALAPSAEGTKYRENALTGNSFAELGIEMKDDGKPRLEVSYYRRRIEL